MRLSAHIVLIGGFGGMLIIMAAAAIYSSRISRELQAANAQMRQDYLLRARTLDEIRQSLYESGNAVRDYILVDNAERTTESLRGELKALRKEMDEACEAYPDSLRAGEKVTFEHLCNEVQSYWSTLVPLFGWDAKAKRERGYAFLFARKCCRAGPRCWRSRTKSARWTISCLRKMKTGSLTPSPLRSDACN
jgi:hypothetical protein